MDLVQKFGGGVLAFILPIMGMKWQVDILITLDFFCLTVPETSLTPFSLRPLHSNASGSFSPPVWHFALELLAFPLLEYHTLLTCRP